jgi:hypothetical protein
MSARRYDFRRSAHGGGRRRGAGPSHGLLVRLGFELVIASALGLSQAKRLRLVD